MRTSLQLESTVQHLPQLVEQSSCSFHLVNSTPAALAAWLEQHGYRRSTIKAAGIECYRLEKPTPRRERAIAVIFSSGSVLCQGNPEPRDKLIALLAELVTPSGQIELLGGVQ